MPLGSPQMSRSRTVSHTPAEAPVGEADPFGGASARPRSPPPPNHSPRTPSRAGPPVLPWHWRGPDRRCSAGAGEGHRNPGDPRRSSRTLTNPTSACSPDSRTRRRPGATARRGSSACIASRKSSRVRTTSAVASGRAPPPRPEYRQRGRVRRGVPAAVDDAGYRLADQPGGLRRQVPRLHLRPAGGQGRDGSHRPTERSPSTNRVRPRPRVAARRTRRPCPIPAVPSGARHRPRSRRKTPTPAASSAAPRSPGVRRGWRRRGPASRRRCR